ncbi:exopolysaccharide biosynthesis protein [Cerasicoccus maritimus]|uniref:exopolysaccharide biosynthesis protein n=1 Tax=Cerasicoccus maritimus TaxID=490089 RepID=UPI0028524B38|nr:exopolysaccharide biosynthesis protein [Cerasicoccus maritimus]
MQDNHKTSLCEALARFRAMDEKRSYSIGEILQAIDEKGFGLVLVILSLPSALPVPAAGYSTPFGLAMLAIGIQMLQGKHSPWLPEKAKNISLPQSFFQKMISGATKFLGFLERFIRPRLRGVTKTNGRRALSFLVILMACLMTLPIPGTNTFPAFVIFLIGVCLSEEDGLVALAAMLAGVLAVVIYLVAIYFLIHFFQEYGWGGIKHFLDLVKDFVKDLIGMGDGAMATDPSLPVDQSLPAEAQTF